MIEDGQPPGHSRYMTGMEIGQLAQAFADQNDWLSKIDQKLDTERMWSAGLQKEHEQVLKALEVNTKAITDMIPTLTRAVEDLTTCEESIKILDTVVEEYKENKLKIMGMQISAKWFVALLTLAGVGIGRAGDLVRFILYLAQYKH
jgi:hypothetical protein